MNQLLIYQIYGFFYALKIYLRSCTYHTIFTQYRVHIAQTLQKISLKGPHHNHHHHDDDGSHDHHHNDNMEVVLDAGGM